MASSDIDRVLMNNVAGVKHNIHQTNSLQIKLSIHCEKIDDDLVSKETVCCVGGKGKH